MYIETVFGLPGLGRTMIRALAGFEGYDLPVILAVTLVRRDDDHPAQPASRSHPARVIDPTVARKPGRGLPRLVGRTA